MNVVVVMADGMYRLVISVGYVRTDEYGMWNSMEVEKVGGGDACYRRL